MISCCELIFQFRVGSIKNRAQNIDGLIANVQQAYNAYDVRTLDHIWAHQMACWLEILRLDGGNQYKPPHSGVRRRGRAVRGAEMEFTTAVNLTLNIDEYNRVYNIFYP